MDPVYHYICEYKFYHNDIRVENISPFLEIEISDPFYSYQAIDKIKEWLCNSVLFVDSDLSITDIDDKFIHFSTPKDKLTFPSKYESFIGRNIDGDYHHFKLKHVSYGRVEDYFDVDIKEPEMS